MLYMYRIVTSTPIKLYINVISTESQLITLESFLGYGHLKVICLYTERSKGKCNTIKYIIKFQLKQN